MVDDLLQMAGYTNEGSEITEKASSSRDVENLNFLEQLSPTKKLLIDEEDTENIEEIKREFLHLTEANLQSPIVAKKIDLDNFKSRINKHIYSFKYLL